MLVLMKPTTMCVTKLFIFMICLFSFGKATEVKSIEIFRKLSEVNELWLLATSIPEAAVILKHPPYSYHTKKHSSEHVNISEILEDTKSYGAWKTSEVREKIRSCKNDLAETVINVESEWVLKMLDSDGKLSSGLLRGGVIWPGHYAECNSVYAPKDKADGDFSGKYCVTSWTMNLGKKYSKLPLTVGVCVPESCSEGDVKNTSNILHILDRFPVLKQYSSLLSLNGVSCKSKEKTLDVSSIIYLVFVLGFVLVTIAGSVVDLIDRWRSGAKSKIVSPNPEASQISEVILDSSPEATAKSDTNVTTDSTVEKEVSASDKAPLSCNAELGSETIEFQPKSSASSIPKRILKCFSVFTNGEKVLNTDASEGQLLSVHGIRFLSLTWVILGHTYIMSISIIGNRLDVLEEMDSFAFQALLQSPFSVDSFFLLSGFLLTYLFMKEVTKRNGKINWIYFYVHRFWRLTPAYMIVVFFYMYIFKYLGSGPFWEDDHCDADRGSWWKYLLYINNFIPIHQMCIGWSWYLANDMQFYVISPLFLYPLWRWPAVGISVLSALLVATWTVTGVLSYHYDLIPMFVGVTQTKDFEAYEAKMWDSFDMIYDKPYCRIAPYIIGAILGFILHKVNQSKNFLTWWQQVLGWVVGAFCSLSVVYGLYHVEMSRTTALFYNSLCRSSFSVGLAWLIFACETGHGGPITKLLSWKFLIPLSRLTYCAYLVHPILIHGYYQAYQTAMYFTELVMVTNFMGFLIMSYGLAFIFSLIFESPLMNLEKMVLKRKQ